VLFSGLKKNQEYSMEIIKDKDGVPSSMRVAFVVTVINANLIAIGGVLYGIYKVGSVPEGLAMLVTGLLGTAFAGKAAQAIGGK